MQNFKSFFILNEAKFKNSSKYHHMFDVPMFSIFISQEFEETDLKAKMKFRKTIENMEYYFNTIKDIFAKARNEIHRLGFPSIHANVVFANLSSNTNKITGKIGDVAGYATSGQKFITIDIKYMIDFNQCVKIIVHEWAHLWMFNKSKAFKNAVLEEYKSLLKTSNFDENKIDFDRIIEDKFYKRTVKDPKSIEDIIIDKFSEIFGELYSDDYFKRLMFLNYPSIDSVPPLIKVKVKLKKDLVVYERIREYNSHTIKEGENVYIEKLYNNKFYIGTEVNNRYYEQSIENYKELIQYVDFSDIINNIKLYLKNSNYIKKLKNKFKEDILNSLELKLISIYENITKKELEFYTIDPYEYFSKLANTLLKNYIEPMIFKKSKEMRNLARTYMQSRKDIYNILWVYNTYKPEEYSIVKIYKELYKAYYKNKLKKEYHNTIHDEKKNFEANDMVYLRTIAQDVSNWVSSYGLANENEFWATLIEHFFKLNPKLRRDILNRLY